MFRELPTWVLSCFNMFYIIFHGQFERSPNMNICCTRTFAAVTLIYAYVFWTIHFYSCFTHRREGERERERERAGHQEKTHQKAATSEVSQKTKKNSNRAVTKIMALSLWPYWGASSSTAPRHAWGRRGRRGRRWFWKAKAAEDLHMFSGKKWAQHARKKKKTTFLRSLGNCVVNVGKGRVCFFFYVLLCLLFCAGTIVPFCCPSWSLIDKMFSQRFRSDLFWIFWRLKEDQSLLLSVRVA